MTLYERKDLKYINRGYYSTDLEEWGLDGYYGHRWNLNWELDDNYEKFEKLSRNKIRMFYEQN